MSSLIVCRILASNYQANNHHNRAGAKCPIFLVMYQNPKFGKTWQFWSTLLSQKRTCHANALELALMLLTKFKCRQYACPRIKMAKFGDW